MINTLGIHHITAIVGHPKENMDFYAGVLGLRFVKKTVNFDDPSTYHFYFGNNSGDPGTIITFFPWPKGAKGKIGAGQVGTTIYAIPVGSLPFWENRLKKFEITYKKYQRFDETYLACTDPHGLEIEFVESEHGKQNNWTFGDITPEVAIKGFAGAMLLSNEPDKTAQFLEEKMGFEKVGTEGDIIRYQTTTTPYAFIEVKRARFPKGKMGIGTVHHIAWRAIDDKEQLDWKQKLENERFIVTEVRDRNYFRSIYFKEVGDILYEIATDKPGFAHDESYKTMGEKLMLPEQYEHLRNQLEKKLIPVKPRVLD